jgi:hypothetical protein
VTNNNESSRFSQLESLRKKCGDKLAAARFNGLVAQVTLVTDVVLRDQQGLTCARLDDDGRISVSILFPDGCEGVTALHNVNEWKVYDSEASDFISMPDQGCFALDSHGNVVVTPESCDSRSEVRFHIESGSLILPCMELSTCRLLNQDLDLLWNERREELYVLATSLSKDIAPIVIYILRELELSWESKASNARSFAWLLVQLKSQLDVFRRRTLEPLNIEVDVPSIQLIQQELMAVEESLWSFGEPVQYNSPLYDLAHRRGFRVTYVDHNDCEHDSVAGDTPVNACQMTVYR